MGVVDTFEQSPVFLLLYHLSFNFQRSGCTMGRVTDQFSSYLSRRCLSPSASSGTTTITKVRFDKNIVHTKAVTLDPSPFKNKVLGK